MYRFQIRAQTKVGETIVLVGSTPELGLWDVAQGIILKTSADRYPLWETEAPIAFDSILVSAPHTQVLNPNFDVQKIHYKYVRLSADGAVEWETWGTDRWVPIDAKTATTSAQTIVVDDGGFGYVQAHPYGYLEASTPELIAATITATATATTTEIETSQQSPINQSLLETLTLEISTLETIQKQGLKIVVIGSSVALGQKAWLLQGWAQQLGQILQEKYGHQLVNVSEAGATVSRTLDRFAEVVSPEQPDVVIIALSLGNEGLSHCPPHQRRALQRRFESGLQQLVKLTRQLGARPILGSVYPHEHYGPEHHWLLNDTHQRMIKWGVPLLDWLAVLSDPQGRWRSGLSYDPAHPNTWGHQVMLNAIDLSLFDIDPIELAAEKQHFLQRFAQQTAQSVYFDPEGFEITVQVNEKHVRIRNTSPYAYTIAPYWKDLQTAITKAQLIPGLYLAKDPQPGILPYFAVQIDGTIETTLPIPQNYDGEYVSAFHLFSPNNSQVLFYDGHLGVLQFSEKSLWIINETDHPFNVHPMWREVSQILKALPQGVYDDPLHPHQRFTTLMIGSQGLESRVKVGPKSALLLQYKCPLPDISRVAILPLGDRCAVRMLLHKLDYDGPAFPFDLTRTTQIADIADIVENQFADMWNPALLNYSAEAGRIYHRKWSGLSFAHEVEDWEDPERDMSPIYDRMRTRYSARAERFAYTLHQCDEVLFIRTGIADRNGAINLVNKLEKQCNGKPFRLLLLSPQDSSEFEALDHVIHHHVEFNPDYMCADLTHWLHCADLMRDILDSLNVSSKNLFWCPPKTPSGWNA